MPRSRPIPLQVNAGHPFRRSRSSSSKAQEQGLWNLFLPVDSAQAAGFEGAGLTNQEYAPLAEIMGRVLWCSEVFNCSAPDTGNMETIARYGSEENKATSGSSPCWKAECALHSP
jgi:acyl-CoA dehydrogenase